MTGFTSIIAGSTSRPVRELRGFQRTLLAPGEKKTLRLTVGKDELSFWSPDAKVWVEESEAFDVWIGGGLYAHYTTHIEHANFNVLVATFAIAYPIVGGLRNVFGTLAAVIFVQVVLIEVLRFLGDWRNLLFGALIILAMNLRPHGIFGRGRA